MPPPEKRPAPPAPDPNWERELHPPPGGEKRPPADARDPLLAHALLQAKEPDPLDFPLFDDPTEVDRTTLPPPEEMSDHVARMMAQASALDEVDDTGDRPTPLVEIPIAALGRLDPQAQRRDAPRAAQPPRDPRSVAAHDARSPLPRGAAAPIGAARGAPSSLSGSARGFGAGPSGSRGAGAPDPRVDPLDDWPQTLDSVRGTSASAPRGPEASPPSGGLRTNIAAIQPVRPPSRTNMPAVTPARPPSRTNMPAVTPARPPSWTNMPAATPARPPSQTNVPVTPARSPSRTNIAAIQPVRPPSRTNMPAVRGPATPAPPAPSGPPVDLRLDSMDFSDLPAVFALDEGEPTVDAPVMVAAAFAAASDDTWAEPAITSAPEPWSEPAISPPFDSDDLRKLLPRDASMEKLAAIEARIAAGDFGRALVLAEAALVDHPGDTSVSKHAESCRDALYRRYLDRLGASDHVPRLAVHAGAITGLSLDHRAGFLLSCVDGDSTIEEIIDVSAMPRLDAVRILYELVQDGVIEMKTRR